MYDVDSRPMRQPVLIERAVIDELVLLNPALPDQPVFLNEVAIAIWRLMDGSHSIKHISTLIAADYDAQPADIEPDIIDLIYQLDAIQALAHA